MNWEYGKVMLKQEDIESLDDWSDDKEMAFRIMDRDFDYLWDDSGDEIHFIDRLYDSQIEDSMTEKRRQDDELELWFDNFTDVFKWIINNSAWTDDEWYDWVRERIEKGE